MANRKHKPPHKSKTIWLIVASTFALSLEWIDVLPSRWTIPVVLIGNLAIAFLRTVGSEPLKWRRADAWNNWSAPTGPQPGPGFQGDAWGGGGVQFDAPQPDDCVDCPRSDCPEKR